MVCKTVKPTDMQLESWAEKITKTSLKVSLDFKSIVMRYSVLLLRSCITAAELYVIQLIYTL